MREHFLHEFADASRHELGDVFLDVEDFLEVRESIARVGVEVVLDEHQGVDGVLLLVDFVVQVVLVVFEAHVGVVELDRLGHDLEEHVLLSLESAGEGGELAVSSEYDGFLVACRAAELSAFQIDFGNYTQNVAAVSFQVLLCPGGLVLRAA